ncbi:4321_t:CDS:1 [Dentiscutata erythropus]|uniref:4321_t:CDS:1 n=1 Tax=Dentiscutata erythropus TaxID=1348616 RepID=A0A9N9A7R6_9GLOM|nr:4321_t:CDS:1 [Dentiscutata erythropus]
MSFRTLKIRFILILIFMTLVMTFIKYEKSYNVNNFVTNEEKYLTYLPHDGFNNQRISLENAIFLAWFLKRTLIIPPLLLFEGIAPAMGRPYNKTYNFLTQFLRPDKNQFKYCSKSRSGCDIAFCFREGKKTCLMVNYTMYNWEELIDFTFLKNHIKYIHRQDFEFNHLLKSLSIYDSSEVYNVTNDNVRYQQRYYDDPTSTIELDNFKERVNLIDLSKRTEKLIHFASVFSETRIVRELSESIEFWNKLIREMLPNNPLLIYTVDKIFNKIGGINSYIGVHARLKDGFFIKNRKNTIKGLIERIQEGFEDDVCLTKKIYLAIDVKRNHPSLKPFFQTFSCIYVLDDFNDFLEPLKFLRNPRDGMILYKFLIPLVDLLVASKGSRFYGSINSTFSDYAQRLNEAWIR